MRSNSRLTRFLATVAVLVAAILVTFVHFRVAARGTEYAGPLRSLDLVFDLALVLVIVAVGAALGRLLLARLFPRLGSRTGSRPDSEPSATDATESLLYGVALGLGALATAYLCLGFLSLLDTWALVALLVVAAGVSWRELRSLPGLVGEVVGFVRPNGGGPRVLVFNVVVLGVVALFLLILAGAPPVDWDALMYHLQVPAQFLEQGRIHVPEDNLHVAFSGLVHMLYLPMLALESQSGPALLSAVMALLLGLAVFRFCVRFFGGSGSGANDSAGVVGSIGMATIWGTGSVLLVAITPRVDVTLALYLFLGHYALVRALTDAETRRANLYLSVVLLGLAFAAKYQAVPYALVLIPFGVWAAVNAAGDAAKASNVTVRTRSGAAGAARLLGGLALVGMLVIAPWLVMKVLLLGSPVYPFLADRLLEPWLASIYGTATVPETVSQEIWRAFGAVREPFNLIDAFFAPGQLTVESEGAFYHASPLFLLLLFWPLVWRQRILAYLLLPAIAYALILVLPGGRTNLRYLIPMAAPLTVVGSYVLVRGCDRLLPSHAVRPVVILLATLVLVPTVRAGYASLTGTRSLGYLMGRTSTTEYMVSHFDPGVRVYGSLVEFLDESAPPNARMLMLFEARGYHLRTNVIQDNRLTNWPLVVPHLSDPNCLGAVGATHLILATGSLSYYVSRGLDPAVLALDGLQGFVSRCLQPIYEGPGFAVFESR
jgi:hypothetical protein